MLRSRSLLLEEARSKINETYDFKKGKSRSKRYVPAEISITPKRPKINQVARLTRMDVVEQDIKHIEERISYKQKRRQMAEDIRNYRACDELTEEIGDLIKEKRQMTTELTLLSKKDEHSKRYFKQKASSSSSRSSSSFPPSDSETRVERSDSHDTLPVTSDDDSPF